MKKNILIIISLLAICLVVIFGRKLLPGQHWRVVSDQYIALFPMHGFVMHAHAKASQPKNFSSDMSDETYSDSLVFQNFENLQGGESMGRSPLPYPPVEIYCVVGEFWGDDQTEFFFVALHSDGVHSDWVVHTPTGSWKNIRNLMDKIGCAIARY